MAAVRGMDEVVQIALVSTISRGSEILAHHWNVEIYEKI